MEALGAVLALDGIGWLAVAVMVGGMVRGFAGFGSGMVIMPVASSVLSPVAAIVMLTLIEFLGPVPNLPHAWRNARRAEAAMLALGALIGLPFGIWVLSRVHADVFGWMVSGAVLTALPLLITGWRYRGVLTRPLILGAGTMGGMLGGAVGLPGPPVIMMYMASVAPAASVRANFLLYLLSVDVMMIAMIAMLGLFDMQAMVVALLVVVPYMAANRLGAALFRPDAETAFRAVAFTIIGASAILGLPLWG